MRRALIVALWMMGMISAAGAAPADTNKTIITANRLTFDYKRYIAIFEDNVVVRDAKMTMTSDQLTVVFNRTNDVKSVTATGNVRMQSQDKVGTCTKAVYLAATEEVLLSGNAKLTRGKDSVSGDRITFYLNQEKVICEPGQLVIFPENDGAALPGTF